MSRPTWIGDRPDAKLLGVAGGHTLLAPFPTATCSIAALPDCCSDIAAPYAVRWPPAGSTDNPRVEVLMPRVPFCLQEASGFHGVGVVQGTPSRPLCARSGHSQKIRISELGSDRSSLLSAKPASSPSAIQEIPQRPADGLMGNRMVGASLLALGEMGRARLHSTLASVSMFSLFTYITPLLENVTGISPRGVTGALLMIGNRVHFFGGRSQARKAHGGLGKRIRAPCRGGRDVRAATHQTRAEGDGAAASAFARPIVTEGRLVYFLPIHGPRARKIGIS
jgi:hypothetical protein